MAEVFLAERHLPGRKPQRVALKRVLPRLRDDGAMTGMLDDEIELGLRCKHPNVISTLGYGTTQGHAFAVLEFVDGLDLASLREILSARGQVFSRAEAVHIAMRIAAGLRYLHGLRDDHGQTLGIVHRDVTPPNVLLGRKGAVKLCDFGFVRSNQQRTMTEPGLIKGKFSYLSPEAALGEPIEARSDLFAVGIILWEMLTMRKLFRGDTDYDTVKLIQAASVPSMAALGADVDDVLQELVFKALARNPQDRFPDAESLHNSLAAYCDYADLKADLGKLVRGACAYRDSRAAKQSKRRRTPKSGTRDRTQIDI